MQPLRLAVDARVIAEDTRGIGRYARAVLRRLVVRDDVALTLLTDQPFPRRRRGAYARVLRSAAFEVKARAAGSLDLIWHPANGTFFSSGLPSVATIHDAVPFRYPDADPKRRAHAQDPFLRSVRGASQIIAVSQFGKGELHELLAIPLDRMEVIEHGVDESFTPGATDLLPAALRGKRFLLFVGDPTAEPRKNFAMLYEAYRRAWPSNDGPALAVAGARAPELPGVVHAGNFTDDLSGVANESLRACYRGALALTLASYHETFGMPMLEAMACGTPVVASRASCLPEIAGDAALYAPPDDAAAWATALRRIVEDDALREPLRLRGLARAKQFTWERSVLRHLAVFRSVAR
ncbi:MAG TPA: glycosyltransferase family 1 protein [Candidatus Cybelea sp.]|jgi:glycosyltransferase involved in cell wall biosynthesis|nr:glycosyltransferase family 1 protein [Candidatus Cybelea sp.]